MRASAVVYVGAIVTAVGLLCLIHPLRVLRVPTRQRALFVSFAGITIAAIGLLLPARESRVQRVESHLDEFLPVWQFHELHGLHIDAPPAAVFAAIEEVRADEIRLLRTLTWIRRCGQEQPEGILNPGSRKPILDVALETGFFRLARVASKELVIGTVIAAPRELRATISADTFEKDLPPGVTLAAMNFVVRPDGSGSMLTTETRVFSNSTAARRRFAAYWRVIYPGSALIRRMWLRAIERRATAA
jgi:hypothetical protein